MALTVNIHEAKTNLSKLLARVSAGEEIIIANAGNPVARLVPISPNVDQRIPGRLAGLASINPDFNEPLSQDIIAEFEK